MSRADGCRKRPSSAFPSIALARRRVIRAGRAESEVWLPSNGCKAFAADPGDPEQLERVAANAVRFAIESHRLTTSFLTVRSYCVQPPINRSSTEPISSSAVRSRRLPRLGCRQSSMGVDPPGAELTFSTSVARRLRPVRRFLAVRFPFAGPSSPGKMAGYSSELAFAISSARCDDRSHDEDAE